MLSQCIKIGVSPSSFTEYCRIICSLLLPRRFHFSHFLFQLSFYSAIVPNSWPRPHTPHRSIYHSYPNTSGIIGCASMASCRYRPCRSGGQDGGNAECWPSRRNSSLDPAILDKSIKL